MILSSTPSLEEFVPLDQQLEIISLVRTSDYSSGVKEIVLSGSVGSAKSILLAHLAVTHCLIYSNANFGIGRLALPQLKATLVRKIREHLRDVNLDYKFIEHTGQFKFPNGSRITSVSWADGNLEKLGSYEFSSFAIEELIESKESRAYDKILQRVGRLPHIEDEKFIISATNPAGPSHWVFDKLIRSRAKNVHVFYSKTEDNPYLPESYIETLKERLSEKEARRMLYGEWVDDDSERIYYAYNPDINFRDFGYQFNRSYPLRLLYDFNIGDGKPLSLVLGQYIPPADEWHFFDEVIVKGQRTEDSLEEALNRGLLDLSSEIIIHGDATGTARDTRSKLSDYEIIERFLANLKDRKIVKREVPRSNPPIRSRHNIVNGYCMNALGRAKLFVYKNAPTVDEGLQKTRLRDKSSYLEREDPYQHCTTAIGYGICVEAERVRRRDNGAGQTFQL